MLQHFKRDRDKGFCPGNPKSIFSMNEIKYFGEALVLVQCNFFSQKIIPNPILFLSVMSQICASMIHFPLLIYSKFVVWVLIKNIKPKAQDFRLPGNNT